jgi:hypothetical protein
MYYDLFNKHNMPYYVYLNDELVIVEYKEWRKRSGKGRSKQCFFHLSDGRIKHSSFFRKVDNVKELIRDLKLKQILND